MKSKTILLLLKDMEARLTIRNELVQRGYLLLTATDRHEAAYIYDLLQGQIHLTIVDTMSLRLDDWPDRPLWSSPILVLLDCSTSAIVADHSIAEVHYLARPVTADGISRKVQSIVEGTWIANEIWA